MQALDLLRTSSEAYANLPFLDARLHLTARQEEDGYRSVVEQSARAVFSRPNRACVEHLGRRGQTIVSDGTHHHVHFYGPGGYHVSPQHRLPGVFQPEYPATGDVCFLFERLHERVASASIAGEANVEVDGVPRACTIVAVTYEPGPHPALVTIPHPLRFFLDNESSLVLRREFDMLYHPRQLTHPQATAHTVEFTSLNIATPPDPALFTYTPPPGVTAQRHATGTISTGAASGVFDPTRGFQNECSNSWDGDELVETARYRFKGHNVAFERRWRLLEHPKVVVIAERIDGPAVEGETRHERTLSLPYA